MRQIGQLAVRIIVASVLALLVVPSTFADWRPAQETWRVANRHLNIEGRITSIYRDRGGFRITLDRQGTFYVSNFEVNRAPRRMFVGDLKVGAVVRLNGYTDRAGAAIIDGVEWIGGRDPGRYERGTLRGTVHRLDLRHDRMTVRDEQTGRTIEVDMARVDRRGRGVNLDDLRRGDRVTLFGGWINGELFGAERIESVHTRY
jgi:hypothetical protein